MSGNLLGDKGVESLIDWMSRARISAENLKLFKNCFGDWGAICIAAHIEDSGKGDLAAVKC